MSLWRGHDQWIEHRHLHSAILLIPLLNSPIKFPHAYFLLKSPTKYSPLLVPLRAWWWRKGLGRLWHDAVHVVHENVVHCNENGLDYDPL
eukprot:SAG11_NODE_18412_length_492_cov_0.516539_1_plen_89_part_10